MKYDIIILIFKLKSSIYMKAVRKVLFVLVMIVIITTSVESGGKNE